MLRIPEEVGQGEYLQTRFGLGERVDIDPVNIDRSQLGLFDGLLLRTKLGRGIYLHGNPPAGPLFQEVSHLNQPLGGGVGQFVVVRRLEYNVLFGRAPGREKCQPQQRCCQYNGNRQQQYQRFSVHKNQVYPFSMPSLKPSMKKSRKIKKRISTGRMVTITIAPTRPITRVCSSSRSHTMPTGRDELQTLVMGRVGAMVI